MALGKKRQIHRAYDIDLKNKETRALINVEAVPASPHELCSRTWVATMPLDLLGLLNGGLAEIQHCI